MITFKSTLDRANRRVEELSEAIMRERMDHNRTLSKYMRLQAKWNDLVNTINEKGGQDFLDSARIGNKNQNTQFTQEEIRKLILLCHPDKHDGKQMAVELTQKLINLRG